jgi:hypothetical protein
MKLSMSSFHEYLPGQKGFTNDCHHFLFVNVNYSVICMLHLTFQSPPLKPLCSSQDVLIKGDN